MLLDKAGDIEAVSILMITNVSIEAERPPAKC